MIAAEAEGLHTSAREGFADAVTFAFGDPEAARYGLARIGVQPGEPATASVLGVLFAGGEVEVAVAEGGLEVREPSWEALSAGPLGLAIEEPLAAWRVRWEGALDLRFTAASTPVETEAGGMQGYEQVCRVQGDAGGARVACLGQRGHHWGVADWERIALARNLCGWWDDGQAFLLSAIRPAAAGHHSEETVSAHLIDDGAVEVAEPRLSTTYDAEGRQRRAGLELLVTGEDDEYPRRAAGRVSCGTSLDLGRLRLDCAFFEWRMGGRAGVGRYDVLRRA